MEIQYGKAIFYKGSTQNRIPAGKLKNVGTSAAVLSELVKRLIEHLGQWCIEKVILSKQPDFIEKIRLSLMPIKWEISYCGIGKQGIGSVRVG